MNSLCHLIPIIQFIDNTSVKNTYFQPQVFNKPTNEKEALLASKNLQEWMSKSLLCSKDLVDECATIIKNRNNFIPGISTPVTQEKFVASLFKEALAEQHVNTSTILSHCKKKYKMLPISNQQKIKCFFKLYWVKTIFFSSVYFARVPLANLGGFCKNHIIKYLSNLSIGGTVFKIINISTDWKTALGASVCSYLIAKKNPVNKILSAIMSYQVLDHTINSLYQKPPLIYTFGCVVSVRMSFVNPPQEEYWKEKSIEYFTRDLEALNHARREFLVS